MWSSREYYTQMIRHQHVWPEWFYNWVPKAVKKWPDLVLTFDDGFLDVIVPAIWATKTFNIRVIVFVPTAHIGQRFPGSPYGVMSKGDLAFLFENGVEIGSHGHLHLVMTLFSRDYLHQIFESSKEVLGGIIGEVPLVFAPPHGKIDMKLISVAKKHGFEQIFGTNISPAGKVDGVYARCLASMEGFVDENGVENKWPWEE
jgi:peptidoglycan/xylan/chitin deacetylase (PgdA/CDA1 family)